MTPEDVTKLVELMVKHGVTRVVCGDVTLERPQPERKHEPAQDPFEQFMKLPRDQQEAALMLQRTRQ